MKRKRSARHDSDAVPITLPPGSLDGPLGPKLLEKRITISWSCSVTIRDIDPKVIREHMEATCRKHGRERDGAKLADTVEAQADVQRKLLQAVLAAPELLERYLLSEVGGLLIDEVHDELVASEEDPDEILASAIEALPSGARQYLQEAAEDGFLEENTEQFRRAIEFSASEMTIEGLDDKESDQVGLQEGAP